MDGQTVKKILKDNNIPLKQVAEVLGMKTSNLSTMLSKQDIRSGLIEDIAKASGIPILFFYNEGGVNNNAPIITGNNNRVYPSCAECIEHSNSIISKSQEQIDRLLRMLEKKLDGC